MRWNTIYVSESTQDATKKVLRIHDIGDSMNVLLEMKLGTLNFSDQNILAVVNGDKNTIETAKALGKELGLTIEGMAITQ